jgi:hypothetical protein
MVHRLAVMGNFTDSDDTEYLAAMMEGRLEKILERYLTRLSPLADLRVEGGATLCATDLAALRHLRADGAFYYSAEQGRGHPLAVERRADATVCVTPGHVAPDGGPPDADSSRYVGVSIQDGVASGPLLAYLYDLGPSRGFRLAGLERPEP